MQYGAGCAYRLNAGAIPGLAQTPWQGHKKGTPTAESLLLAWLGVGLYHTGARGALRPDDHGVSFRCRWQVEIAIKRWKSVLDVDALRAKAHSPLAAVWLHGKLLYALMLSDVCGVSWDRWGRLDQERGHVVARLGHAQRRDSPDDYWGLVLKEGRLGGMLEGVNGTASPEDITTAALQRSTYSIAAMQANKRVSQLQHNGRLSRGTHAYPGANGPSGRVGRLDANGISTLRGGRHPFLAVGF